MSNSRLVFFIKTRWVLVVVLIALVLLKIPHPQYPFFCDEGWVYAPAVKSMAVNGPSLLPGSISSDYSRGHPLLFHFLCSLWILCFGTSNVSLHSFPLFITVVFIIALYEGCLRLFNNRVAVLVLLLVMSQVIFFVQASFVLPEIMVALFAFLSLYYYSKDKLLLTSVMLSLLLLTKESGLVFGAVMGVHALVALFRKDEPLVRRVLRLVALIIPALLLGTFFLLQKAKEGWYLFPLHSSLINLEWEHFYFWFRTCIRCTFKGDNASYYVGLLIMLLGIPVAIVKRNLRYLFLCLSAIVVFALTSDRVVDALGSGFLVSSFIVALLVSFYCFFSLYTTIHGTAHLFLVLVSCCFGAYLFFSSLSVITYRYLIVEIMFVMILLAVSINMFTDAFGRAIYYTAIAGILAIGAIGYCNDGGNDDTDLEAFNAMKVEQAVVRFLEKENAYDKEITGGCFWELQHFRFPEQGFLTTSRTFTKISGDTATTNTDYAIFDNVCPDQTHDRMQRNGSFHLVFKQKVGETWAEIYKRNDL